MIKALMKVISENCNTGCYSPPSLKEISSRDLRKEWGCTRNDEGCIDGVTRRTTRQLKEGRLLGTIRDDILLDNGT
jgi:hypothetical protein